MNYLYSKVMFCLYYFSMLTMKSLLIILTDWRVYGRENLPKEGPVLIVANHVNLIDPPLLAASLPRKLTFMAKRELFTSAISRPLIQAFSFPVSRGNPNRDSIYQADITLKKGKPLTMFPEGKRSPDYRLLPGFPGSALIALRSNAPLLPVGLCGSQQITNMKSLFRHPKIVVKIGKPFYLPDYGKTPNREHLNEATGIIMRHIAELLPDEHLSDYGKSLLRSDVG
ncbi:MAG: lysophospholipid acyltransferase family protein [Chloroflexi bacterium]|nr:lysophospholipid acyltransferase family protein [Chloroflexota bacterium]